MNVKPCHSVLSCLETNEAAQSVWHFVFEAHVVHKITLKLCVRITEFVLPLFPLHKKVQQLHAAMK